MLKQIFEIGWVITCGELEFPKTEWKVFETKNEAEDYGLLEQTNLNESKLPDEKAWDGYFYRFQYALPVNEVDGYSISLASQLE